MKTDWAGLVARMASGRVLVVGDVMLDHYVWGEVERVSPEAPVPVLEVRGEERTPGGAANVACKLAELGAQVVLVGVCGRDEASRQLIHATSTFGVDCSGLVEDPERPTTIKTRCIARSQHLLRVDRELRSWVSGAVEQELVGRVGRLLDGCIAVAVVDYHKGVLTDAVLRAVLLRGMELPAVVDPRGTDYRRYRGATLIAPNHRELETAASRKLDSDQAMVEAARRLLEDSGAKAIAIKRGPEGITLVYGDGWEHVPTVPVEVYDVTGAGDAVTAVYTLALAGGLTLREATELANVAGGIIVQQLGAGRISREAILRAASARTGNCAGKIVSLELAREAARRVQRGGGKVVFTNGCFDILHPGHVYLLEKAAEKGDFLVVGLNSDESVRRIKGPGRPARPELDRAQVLAALSSVDMVVIFDEDTPMRLIEAIRPDVLVKGGEYAESEIVGASFVKSYGGEVVRVPLLEVPGTSDIIAHIKTQAVSATCERRQWRDA